MKTKMTRINAEAIRDFLMETGVSLAEASVRMGHGVSYINQCLSKKVMPENQVRLFCNLFSCRYEDLIYKEPEPISKPVYAVSTDGTVNPYSITLDVKPDKINFSVNFYGEPVYSSYAAIRGKRELDLLQAISYAAHLCYKFAQQDEFKKN